MSEITRYEPTKSVHYNGEECYCDSYAYCDDHSYGEFVKYDDHVKVVDQLQQRIAQLESEQHINEIKAQGIEYAVEYAAFDCTVYDDPVSVLEKVEHYAKKLRSNDE